MSLRCFGLEMEIVGGGERGLVFMNAHVRNTHSKRSSQLLTHALIGP